MADNTLQNAIQEKYGQAAKAILKGARASCCGAGTGTKADPITSNLYSADQVAGLPQEAVLASFGCGNPMALADLKLGEIVLDLGAGGGIDVLLSAKRVGPAGKAYGLDMTPDMLELARHNQEQAGIRNAEFLQGTIEAIPLPDQSVDVIISNCVINLSGDKDRVLREAFRVLRPGGRFAVSDIALRRELPAAVKRSMELWTGCIAGALRDEDYAAKLKAAGFEAIEIEPTRVYDASDAEALAKADASGEANTEAIVQALDGAVMSAFIRARKPGAERRDFSPQPAVTADSEASSCCVRDAKAKAARRTGCGCDPGEGEPEPAKQAAASGCCGDSV